jgi:hypothetical protein
MPSRRQGAFRWRHDDGNETSATWIATANTSITGTTDTNYRLRIESDLVGTGDVSWTPKLQYNKNSVGWNDVNGSSSVARSTDSPNMTDNAATTQQISSGVWAAGKFDEADGSFSTGISLSDAAADTSEHELCFQVRSADVSAGDQIQFRLVATGGSTYELYGTLPVFTVAGSSKSQFMAFF